MFDMMKMMGKMKEVQQKMKEAQDQLKDITTLGESGGGMVKALRMVKKNSLDLEIDESLINLNRQRHDERSYYSRFKQSAARSRRKIERTYQKIYRRTHSKYSRT